MSKSDQGPLKPREKWSVGWCGAGREEMSVIGWPAAASALARAAKKIFFEHFWDLENFSEKFLKKV